MDPELHHRLMYFHRTTQNMSRALRTRGKPILMFVTPNDPVEIISVREMPGGSFELEWLGLKGFHTFFYATSVPFHDENGKPIDSEYLRNSPLLCDYWT